MGFRYLILVYVRDNSRTKRTHNFPFELQSPLAMGLVMRLVMESLPAKVLGLVMKEERMGDISDDVDSYSPKTRKVMRHMKRLEEKLERVGGGLESLKIDTQSKSKTHNVSMQESEGSHSESPITPSIRSHRLNRSERLKRERRHEEEEPRRERKYEDEPMRVRRYEEESRRSLLDTLKCKIPPF
ncbi:hypothetical protein CR513_50122, partial [Mucuna pruriens]